MFSIGTEPNLFSFAFEWRHDLANRFKDHFELMVVRLFKFIKVGETARRSTTVTVAV